MPITQPPPAEPGRRELADIQRFLKMFGCDTARISRSMGKLFLIIGWKRNTKDDPGQWYRNGEPIDFDYTHEEVIASGENDAAHSVPEGLEIAGQIGYPVMIRPAFTLQGKGSALAHDKRELETKLESALRSSPTAEALIESGWAEAQRDSWRLDKLSSLLWDASGELTYKGFRYYVNPDPAESPDEGGDQTFTDARALLDSIAVDDSGKRTGATEDDAPSADSNRSQTL
jgi:hypothetical protein